MRRSTSRLWASEIVSCEAWAEAMKEAGLAVTVARDLGDAHVRHFEDLLARASRKSPFSYPASEVRAWELGRDLGRAGILGYGRIVGKRE
jgi:hypothetical protein